MRWSANSAPWRKLCSDMWELWTKEQISSMWLCRRYYTINQTQALTISNVRIWWTRFHLHTAKEIANFKEPMIIFSQQRIGLYGNDRYHLIHWRKYNRPVTTEGLRICFNWSEFKILLAPVNIFSLHIHRLYQREIIFIVLIFHLHQQNSSCQPWSHKWTLHNNKDHWFTWGITLWSIEQSNENI